MHLATTKPWIESLMVNHITERKNNSEIVKRGGFTYRMAMKKVANLGGTVETLDANTRVHMVADVEHSNLFEPILRLDDRSSIEIKVRDRFHIPKPASCCRSITRRTSSCSKRSTVCLDIALE